MAEIESTYASSVTKLLKSISYTFHSNLLMQWLGSEPFEELGYVTAPNTVLIAFQYN